MEDAPKRGLIDRMIGAARLDVEVYEELEHDTTATPQAALVVGLVAVASAVGGAGDGSLGIIGGLVTVGLGWAVWSWVTYFVGTRLFGGTADWGEMLRTLGFAHTPGLLYGVGAIAPLAGAIASPIAWVWMLVAGVVAIRQALDFDDTWTAIATVGMGWVAMIGIKLASAVVLGIPLGPLGPMN